MTTLIAGVIADIWGPETGGLFLAFPAIFCASATLVETHERRKKRAHGVAGCRRGTDAAALESAGAALGSIGLSIFRGDGVADGTRLRGRVTGPWVNRV